jgi:hypothetical protein
VDAGLPAGIAASKGPDTLLSRAVTLTTLVARFVHALLHANMNSDQNHSLKATVRLPGGAVDVIDKSRGVGVVAAWLRFIVATIGRLE